MKEALETRLITTVVSEKSQAKVVFVSLLLILSFLTSCGGTPRPGTISNGNWWMKASSSVNSGQVLYVDGPLVQTGSSVNGTVLISTTAAGFSYDTVVLSGDFSGGTLRLAAPLNNGCSITINLTGNEDNLSGTYATTGEASACNDRGTAVAGLVHPIDGIWTGTIYNLDGTESPVSVGITLTQGTFSTANANSPLTGTGTIYSKDPVIPTSVSSMPCTVDASSISGSHVQIECSFLNFRGRIVDPTNSTGISGFTSPFITGTVYLKKIQ
jgi:hypothetical protein